VPPRRAGRAIGVERPWTGLSCKYGQCSRSCKATEALWADAGQCLPQCWALAPKARGGRCPDARQRGRLRNGGKTDDPEGVAARRRSEGVHWALMTWCCDEGAEHQGLPKPTIGIGLHRAGGSERRGEAQLRVRVREIPLSGVTRRMSSACAQRWVVRVIPCGHVGPDGSYCASPPTPPLLGDTP
jgi:hypothetical protein